MLKRIRQIGIACALKKLKHVLFLDEDAKSIAARHGGCGKSNRDGKSG